MAASGNQGGTKKAGISPKPARLQRCLPLGFGIQWGVFPLHLAQWFTWQCQRLSTVKVAYSMPGREHAYILSFLKAEVTALTVEMLNPMPR